MSETFYCNIHVADLESMFEAIADVQLKLIMVRGI